MNVVSVLGSQELDVLRSLQKGGRRPRKAIAHELGMSESYVSKIVTGLEMKGLLLRVGVAILDPKKLGFNTLAFFRVVCKSPNDLPAVEAVVKEWPEIQEVHRLFGDGRILLLKIRARNSAELGEIQHKFREVDGVESARGDVVTTSKETTDLPI